VKQREPEAGLPPEEKPPLGSWARLYLLEFVNLAALILFFYLLAKMFE
jgi:hypothetical protein